MTVNEQGLYRKFNQERLDDPEGKHSECEYFVLDMTHDPAALMAAKYYAAITNDPELRDDLEERYGK